MDADADSVRDGANDTGEVATGIEDRADRDLWLDDLASLLGFGWLARHVPGDLPPSYLYALVTVLGSNALTISYNLANGVPLIYRTNPYFVLQPVLLFAAVYGARTLQAEYDAVMAEMAIAERADDPNPLLDPVP
ncbi:hypothetical protein [Halorientalis halophila]|uniref:hypothetical protein n=1 Tax=Halorientalis halophila TaxID=3108499 RepID=UPI003009EEF4